MLWFSSHAQPNNAYIYTALICICQLELYAQWGHPLNYRIQRESVKQRIGAVWVWCIVYSYKGFVVNSLRWTVLSFVLLYSCCYCCFYFNGKNWPKQWLKCCSDCYYTINKDFLFFLMDKGNICPTKTRLNKISILSPLLKLTQYKCWPNLCGISFNTIYAQP